ncbi:MAG: hypothetical protein ABWX94_03630, partial [Candidatus Saccharimonadales bacterium]
MSAEVSPNSIHNVDVPAVVDIDTVSDSTQFSTTSAEQPTQGKLVITREHVGPEADEVKIKNPFSDEQVSDFAAHVRLVQDKGDALNIPILDPRKTVGKGMLAPLAYFPPALFAATEVYAPVQAGVIAVVACFGAMAKHSFYDMRKSAARLGYEAQKSLGESYELMHVPSTENPEEPPEVAMYYYGQRKENYRDWLMSPLERIQRMADLAKDKGVDKIFIDKELAPLLDLPPDTVSVSIDSVVAARFPGTEEVFKHDVVTLSPQEWLTLAELKTAERNTKIVTRDYETQDLVKILGAIDPLHPIVSIYKAHKAQIKATMAEKPQNQTEEEREELERYLMDEQLAATLGAVEVAIDREFSSLDGLRASSSQQAKYDLGPERMTLPAKAVIAPSSPKTFWSPKHPRANKEGFVVDYDEKISDGRLRIGYRNTNGQISGGMTVEQLLGIVSDEKTGKSAGSQIEARLGKLYEALKASEAMNSKAGVETNDPTVESDNPTRDMRLLIALLAQQLRTGKNGAGEISEKIEVKTEGTQALSWTLWNFDGSKVQETLLGNRPPRDDKESFHNKYNLHTSVGPAKNRNLTRSVRLATYVLLGSGLLSAGLDFQHGANQDSARARLAYEYGVNPADIPDDEVNQRADEDSILSYSWSKVGKIADALTFNVRVNSPIGLVE